MLKIKLQLFADKTKADLEAELNELKAKFAKEEKEKKALAEEKAKLEDANKALSGDIEGLAQANKDLIAAAVAPEAKAQEKTVEDFLEERVPVTLIKDGERYKDDVPVSVNGERILIQRGVTVWVKRKHAQVLENQYKQQMIASDMMEKFAEDFSSKQKAGKL